MSLHPKAPIRRRPRPTRGRIVMVHALLGGFFGYLVLHPVSMVIFQFLDPMRHVSPSAEASFLRPISHSFQLEMLPMAAVFALFCALIAAVNGRHRAVLGEQRNELRESAELLGVQNERLHRLDQANRRATRFLVHDLKGHLGGILGFTDLLLERDDLMQDSRLADALTRIRRQGSWMLEAVWELLDLDRLREGTPLHRETIEVADLLEHARDNHCMVATLGAVQLGEYRLQCPAIHADRRVVLRVIANLLTNALKHNPPGVRVVLDARVGDSPDRVTITCTDNGRGIPEDLAPSLFAEFVAGADTALTDSSGLGLAFCGEAIEAHGGRIWCEPPESSGARFCFTLPVAKGEAPQ